MFLSDDAEALFLFLPFPPAHLPPSLLPRYWPWSTAMCRGSASVKKFGVSTRRIFHGGEAASK